MDHLADPRSLLIQRISVLAVTIIPVIGLAVAVWLAWGRGLGVSDLVAFGVMYLIVGLGGTVGFHRLFAHASFEARSWVRVLLAIAGSMTVMAPVIVWVVVHRRHHASSDIEGDPHSPHLGEGTGFRSQLRGFAHAHIGWMFTGQRYDLDRWAPDMRQDKAIVLVDRLYPLWIALSFLLPAAIGFVVSGGEPMAALTGLLWGGLVRMLVFNHVVYSVNSICHMFGQRPFQTRDQSTNNWVLALPSFGDSWHNNHHAFPGSAVHGLRWWQVDISALFIRTLVFLRLARNMNTPEQAAQIRMLKPLADDANPSAR